MLWVSAYLGTLSALPFVAIALFAICGPILATEFHVALVLMVLSLLSYATWLLPPIYLRGTKEKLPLVTDEQFGQRIKSLSEKMQIPTPSVRLWPSTSAHQQGLAYVGTLQAPQLVVTDGIFHRLRSDECDAVVAHELAHIANGSMYALAALFPIACAVTTAFTFLLPISIAIPLGFLFYAGIRRMFSRSIELDCDHRAAKVAGFRAMASALTKIHAVHPISDTGVLSLLIYATATHPPLVTRIAALCMAAPSHDRPEPAPSPALVRAHHRAAVDAALVWMTAILVTLLALDYVSSDWWLAIPLWVVGLMPQILITVASQKHLRNKSQRSGQRVAFLKLFAIGIPIGLLILGITDYFDSIPQPSEDTPIYLVGTLLAVNGLAIGGWQLSFRKWRKLHHDVAVAVQLHHFQRVIELCAASPDIIRRSHQLRYTQAVAEAVCGNRQTAINSLDQLWRDNPRIPMTALALGEILLDSNLAERAIEVVTGAGRIIPRDVDVPLLEGRALRRLGRNDEAQQACDRAMSLDPKNGCVHALAAALELDRNEVDRVKQQIDRALELSPGDPYVMIVRAEIAVKTEGREQAHETVAQAIETVRSNPLVFLNEEINRLEAAIGEYSSKTASA